MSMLNRKNRRAKKNRRPFSSDSPAAQMKAFLKQPGKFHIVQLAGDKSFVVKVTEAEMPLFLTICQQLRGVLGHCEAIPATPVDASIADTQMIAEDSAQASKRIREARARQEQTESDDFHRCACGRTITAEQITCHACADVTSAPTLRVVREKSDAEIAAMERHPAGKQRPAGGRHRAPEPETTFDKLATGAGAVDDDTKRRLAQIEIAAAQAEAARAQDAYEAANQRLREAYANGGELHNRAVLDKFAEQAGQAIAEHADVQPLCEHKTLHGPTPDGEWICNKCGATVTPVVTSPATVTPTHRCEQPNAAPGDKWRCWCGQAWEAEAHGELDIRWKRWPERSLDGERQAAIDAALRQAGRDAATEFTGGMYDPFPDSWDQD